MKWIRLLLIVLVIGWLVWPTSDGSVQIRVPQAVVAGSSIQVEVILDHPEAGKKIDLLLLNGLQRYQTSVSTNSDGIAYWLLEDDIVTQAGESLLLARYNGTELRHTIKVLPLEPDTTDLFVTLNTIAGYGEGTSTIMLLPRDRYGNAPQAIPEVKLAVLYPNGESATLPFSYRNGLGWVALVSAGDPGRVRLTLQHPVLSASYELQQTASDPANIRLEVNSTCVLADGRDTLSLLAQVTDAYNNPVTDGTLVIFRWENGFGYGITESGQANFRFPAPTTTVDMQLNFIAYARQAVSNVAPLQFKVEGCRND
jgi:hypothetical protein